MANRVIILSCIILVIAFATDWLLKDAITDPMLEDLKRNDPDIYMLDATIRQFADNGDLQYELSADRFTHFPLTDVTILERPNLMLYPQNGTPWTISSSNGRLLSKSIYREEVMELWDDVLLSRQSQDVQFVNIKTQSLTVYPEREYAETDLKVSINDNASTTSAAGMEAHLDQEKLVFFSNREERVNTVIRGSE